MSSKKNKSDLKKEIKRQGKIIDKHKKIIKSYKKLIKEYDSITNRFRKDLKKFEGFIIDDIEVNEITDEELDLLIEKYKAEQIQNFKEDDEENQQD